MISLIILDSFHIKMKYVQCYKTSVVNKIGTTEKSKTFFINVHIHE